MLVDYRVNNKYGKFLEMMVLASKYVFRPQIFTSWPALEFTSANLWNQDLSVW